MCCAVCTVRINTIGETENDRLKLKRMRDVNSAVVATATLLIFNFPEKKNFLFCSTRSSPPLPHLPLVNVACNLQLILYAPLVRLVSLISVLPLARSPIMPKLFLELDGVELAECCRVENRLVWTWPFSCCPSPDAAFVCLCALWSVPVHRGAGDRSECDFGVSAFVCDNVISAITNYQWCYYSWHERWEACVRSIRHVREISHASY